MQFKVFTILDLGIYKYSLKVFVTEKTREKRSVISEVVKNKCSEFRRSKED